MVAATAAALMSRATGDAEFLATVHRGQLAVRMFETGTLKPVRSITYSSPLVGYQSELIFLVREGTRVQPGDILARLDTRALELELEQAVHLTRQVEVDRRVAEAERDQAEADLESVVTGAGAVDLFEAERNLELTRKRAELMRADYERLQPLLENQFITREEFDRLGLELEQAEVEVEVRGRRFELLRQQTRPRNRRQAELRLTQSDARLQHLGLQQADAAARVTALREAISSATVHARQGGLVVFENNLSVSSTRKVRMGDLVTSSQGLVTIPEVDNMLVETSVREADLHRIALGQPARVTVDAFPDGELVGRVVSVGALARMATGRAGAEKRFDVTVELDASERELRPEMTARLDILVGIRENVLTVPVTAVFDQDGVPAVRMRRGSDFVARLVDLGDTDDIRVEVTAGLEEGDQVSLLGDAPAGIPETTATSPRP